MEAIMSDYDETYDYFLNEFFPDADKDRILQDLKVDGLGYAQIIDGASKMINAMLVEGELDVAKLARLNQNMNKNANRLIAMFNAGADFEHKE
jgi:hypothetical protein